MSNPKIHYWSEEKGRSICGLASEPNWCTIDVDKVECKKCQWKIAVLEEHVADVPLPLAEEEPSEERLVLLGLMERRLQKIGIAAVENDSTPTGILLGNAVETGMVVMLGSLISTLYPEADYLGRPFVERTMQAFSSELQ